LFPIFCPLFPFHALTFNFHSTTDLTPIPIV
jgi:hypothetical protein